MFEVFTPYLLGGAIIGLLLFLLLFRFWNLPRKLKAHFKLNTRPKVALFIILAGFVVAVVVTVLVGMIGLPAVAAQLIEGFGIGFSCAVVVGMLNASNTDSGKKTPASGTKTTNRQPSADNRGRRSKG